MHAVADLEADGIAQPHCHLSMEGLTTRGDAWQADGNGWRVGAGLKSLQNGLPREGTAIAVQLGVGSL